MDALPLYQLRLSDHIPKGRVPRVTPQCVQQVREWGFLEPMLVRPVDKNEYEILTHAEHYIVAGHLLLDEIPVQVREDLTDEQARHMVLSQFQSTTMNPIEEAEWFQRRLSSQDTPITQSALARMQGVSRSYVTKSLKLLSLSSTLKEKIRSAELGAGQGRALFRLPCRAQQEKAAKHIIKHQLSARRSEEYCNALLGKQRLVNPSKSIEPGHSDPSPDMTSTPTTDPDILHLEKGVSEILGCTFRIEEGRAVIDYHNNLDILDGVLSRIGYRG